MFITMTLHRDNTNFVDESVKLLNRLWEHRLDQVMPFSRFTDSYDKIDLRL